LQVLQTVSGERLEKNPHSAFLAGQGAISGHQPGIEGFPPSLSSQGKTPVSRREVTDNADNAGYLSPLSVLSVPFGMREGVFFGKTGFPKGIRHS
jgi:hypothetical protein